jgi:hypothetical protein
MKFLERIKNKLEGGVLNKQEKEAIKNIFNDFIFIEPKDFSIDVGNTKELSLLVQEEFLKLKDNQKQAWLIKEQARAERAKQRIDKIKSREKTGDKIQDFLIEKMDNITLTMAESLIENIKKGNYFVMDDYHSWGFTPKLISEKLAPEDIFLKPNCFGIAMLKGVSNKQKNLDTYLLSSVDHPEVMIKKDGKSYIDAGIIDPEQPIKQKLDEKDGYEILRLPEDDKDIQKFFLIFPFDEGMLYEIFENLEVLKRLLRGGEVHGLPGTKEEGLKLAKRFEAELLAGDWRELQRKLFPTIYKAFVDNKQELEKEIERVSGERLKIFASKILNEALEEVRNQQYKDLSFEKATEKILMDSKKYPQEVENFLVSGVPFSDSVEHSLKVTFESLYNEIDKKIELEDNKEKVRIIINERLMRNLKKD